jgi:hypothetical protein
MKFFQKQMVDQIGVTSVSLQKILVVLMILSLLSLFNGGLFSFLICLIGFMGAYKRSPGLLRAYFSISIALIIVAFVFAIVTTVGSLNHHDHGEYSSDSTSSSSYTSNSKLTQAKVFVRRLTSYESSSDSNPSNTSMDTPSSQYESFSDYAVVALVLLALAVVVLGFILIYLKIYSLVLAFRLRKMILLAASTLPTTNPTTPTEPTQVHEFAPTNTSCAVPQEAPLLPPPFPMQFQNPYMFSPGFAPYPYPMPMVPPQNMQAGQQFPHQVMFGQQPVFYTYAPMSPTVPTTPSEEKL